MTRIALLAVAAASVLLAHYVDRRSAHMNAQEREYAARLLGVTPQGDDDRIVTGAVKRGPAR